MYARFKDRFGTAGVVLGVIALILALGGTALAAKGALTGKQKKEAETIAKKYAGAPAAPGAPGAAGANGKDGSNGTTGLSGVDGKSIRLVNSAPADCAEGGFTYEVEDSGQAQEVCNGNEGLNGIDGQPGKNITTMPVAPGDLGCAAGGTKFEVEESGNPEVLCNGETGSGGSGSGMLEPGATEKGFWAFSQPATVTQAWVPISLQQSLASPGQITIHFVPKGTASTDTVCGSGEGGSGGSAAFPLAPPKTLCIFEGPYPGEGPVPNATFDNVYVSANGLANAVPLLGEAGGFIRFTIPDSSTPSQDSGSWALTDNP